VSRGLLPDLDIRDSLEVSAVHSLAGFNLADELISRPPYDDPHHSASVASIVGGGLRMARPGAISCAHNGVLFLNVHGSPIHPIGTRVQTGLPPSGVLVSTICDRTSRERAASLGTEWDGDRVVTVGSDRVVR
jgi:Magnesium chelatase, subunit ChlI